MGYGAYLVVNGKVERAKEGANRAKGQLDPAKEETIIGRKFKTTET